MQQQHTRRQLLWEDLLIVCIAFCLLIVFFFKFIVLTLIKKVEIPRQELDRGRHIPIGESVWFH